jgi:hypothetical protein
MAQGTPSNQNDIADALNEAIKEGKKLTEYLLNDADYLDAAEGLSDGDTRQLDSKSRDSFLRAWSHYIEAGNSDAAIGTIAEALAYLRVGSDKGEQDAYLAYRNVDTEIIPKGPNIALTLVQDKRHYLAIPKVSSSCFVLSAFHVILTTWTSQIEAATKLSTTFATELLFSGILNVRLARLSKT